MIHFLGEPSGTGRPLNLAEVEKLRPFTVGMYDETAKSGKYCLGLLSVQNLTWSPKIGFDTRESTLSQRNRDLSLDKQLCNVNFAREMEFGTQNIAELVRGNLET
jgi:hypothetical protein